LWNSADKSPGITLSNGDTTALHASGTAEGVRGTLALSGKKCWAMTVNNANAWRAGIATLAHDLNATNLGAGTANVIVTSGGSVIFNGGTLAVYTAVANGENLLVAFDDDAGDIWFGRQTGWNGDPAAGTGAAKADVSTASDWYPVFGTTGVGPSGQVTLIDFPIVVPTGFIALNP
jgi:hypothetical protein